MQFALVALRGPSNIEKKVRELQSSLYRQCGLASALALPAVIPLCFVKPNRIPEKAGALREHLRRAVGREAPYLTSGAVAVCGDFLFWDLAPRRELQRLQRSCEKVFTAAELLPADPQASVQPDPFPVARGFFLCSLQGRSRGRVPSLVVSRDLRFPAKAASLLQVRTLGLSPGAAGSGSSAEVERPLWKSLYWEKLEEIPLRKSGGGG